MCAGSGSLVNGCFCTKNYPENAYVELYNRTVRYGWVSQYFFDSIKEVQDFATQWLWFYNNAQPDKASGGLPPNQMPTAA
jgi:putative transposase